MCPILVRFELWGHPVTIASYSAAMVVASVVVVLLGWRIAIRRGLSSPRVLLCLLAMATALIAGSRLADWLTHRSLYEHSGLSAVGRQWMGFSLLGGFWLAIPVGMAVCSLTGLSPWRLADATVPGLGLGVAIMRLGCFFNGCCFGNETSMPWGVTFPIGSPAYLHQAADRFDVLLVGAMPVHPTQLYEMAAALIAGGIAWLLHRRGLRDGVPALVAAVGFLAFCWIDTYLRAEDVATTGPQSFQFATRAVLLLLCLAMLVRVSFHSGEDIPACL